MVDKPDSRFPPTCLKCKLNSQCLAFTIIFQRPSSFVPYNWRFFVDSTDFINFMESTEVPKHSIIVSMDMTSLYIPTFPQEEEINTICKAYDILTTKIDP